MDQSNDSDCSGNSLDGFIDDGPQPRAEHCRLRACRLALVGGEAGAGDGTPVGMPNLTSTGNCANACYMHATIQAILAQRRCREMLTLCSSRFGKKSANFELS